MLSYRAYLVWAVSPGYYIVLKLNALIKLIMFACNFNTNYICCDVCKCCMFLRLKVIIIIQMTFSFLNVMIHVWVNNVFNDWSVYLSSHMISVEIGFGAVVFPVAKKIHISLTLHSNTNGYLATFDCTLFIKEKLYVPNRL